MNFCQGCDISHCIIFVSNFHGNLLPQSKFFPCVTIFPLCGLAMCSLLKLNQFNALLVKAHWRCPVQIWQLWLPFYPRLNISDRFFNLAPHFIRIQIFQIDFEETKWTFLNFFLPLSCYWNIWPTTQEGKRDELNFS